MWLECGARGGMKEERGADEIAEEIKVRRLCVRIAHAPPPEQNGTGAKRPCQPYGWQKHRRAVRCRG